MIEEGEMVWDQLDLTNSRVGDKGMQAKYKAGFKSFRELKLGGNNLTSNGLRLFSTQNWSNLINLNLSYNAINSKGIKYISKASLQKLSKLQLSNNQIESVGLLHLSKMQMHTLNALNLSNNFIENGTRELARGYWKKQKYLQLNNNRLTISQIFNLCCANTLNLQSITLWDNLINPEEISLVESVFTARFAKIRVEFLDFW